MQIASHYYLKYTTMKTLKARIAKSYQPALFAKLIRVLCDAAEFEELPVRHNEGQLVSR
jgi:Sec63 Brl domain